LMGGKKKRKKIGAKRYRGRLLFLVHLLNHRRLHGNHVSTALGDQWHKQRKHAAPSNAQTTTFSQNGTPCPITSNCHVDNCAMLSENGTHHHCIGRAEAISAARAVPEEGAPPVTQEGRDRATWLSLPLVSSRTNTTKNVIPPRAGWRKENKKFNISCRHNICITSHHISY